MVKGKIVTHEFSPTLFGVRFEELNHLKPTRCIAKTAWNSLAGEQHVSVEDAKNSLKGFYSFYACEFHEQGITETVETPHLKLTFYTPATNTQKEQFLSKISKALNMLYLEAVHSSSFSETKKLAKFFSLNKPTDMFYNPSTNTFYIKKKEQYGFDERHLIRVYRTPSFFYIIGKQRTQEAQSFYEKMKVTLETSLQNRQFNVISQQHRVLPSIHS